MRTRVLIVAKETALLAAVARLLTPMRYLVELASNEKTAREQIARAKFKAAIVAANAVDGSDLTFLRELEQKVNDLMVLVGDEAVGERLSALLPEAQACLSKPLEAQKIVTFVGGSDGADRGLRFSDPADVVQFAGCILDIAGRSFLGSDGLEVSLTYREFSLLVVFAQNPGRALSRKELRDAIDRRSVGAYDRSVDMLVARLRRKFRTHGIQPRIIITLPGFGYKFVGKLSQRNGEP
jgi:DNA-binding response OmpR family regulator